MAKVEIDFELLRDLVDAAGWVGNFYNDLQSGLTPEYHPDWGAAQYLASEAVLIEQRGRAVLEAVEHSVQLTGATRVKKPNCGDRDCFECNPPRN